MKVSRRRQITLPASICEKLGIEPGDVVEFKERKSGILVEFRRVNKDEDDESWWLSERWQKGHHQAMEDIREGRISGPFKDGQELLAVLREKADE